MADVGRLPPDKGLYAGVGPRHYIRRRRVPTKWRFSNRVEPRTHIQRDGCAATHALRPPPEIIVSRQKGTTRAGHPGYEDASCSLPAPGVLAPIRGLYFRSLRRWVPAQNRDLRWRGYEDQIRSGKGDSIEFSSIGSVLQFGSA